MVPKHVADVLRTLSEAQQEEFRKLCMWSGDSGLQSVRLPINYDALLEMVLKMGADPIKPVEPPPVVDHELLDRIKILKGG